MTGPLSMVLMSNRSTKECHDPITRKLVDCPLISVDLIHQDLEATIHDLMDFLGIKLFRDGCVVGYISK